MEVLRRHCEASPSLGDSHTDTDTKCKNILNYATEPTGHIDQMDASHFDSDDFIHTDFVEMFTTSARLDELKVALHITKTGKFEKTCHDAAAALLDDQNDAT